MSTFCVSLPDGSTGSGPMLPDPPEPPCSLNLVFEGDSTTIGAGTPPPLRPTSGWPALLVAGLPPLQPPWLYGTHNVAFNGATVTSTMVNEATTEVLNAHDPSAAMSVAILWGGLNDIVSQGESAASIYSGIVAWHAIVDPVYDATVVLTVPPIYKPTDTAAENATYNAVIDALNVLILANAAGFTHVVDVGALPALQTPDPPLPMRVDGVHYTVEGNAVIADAVRPTIAAYC